MSDHSISQLTSGRFSDRSTRISTNLILESVPPSFQVHLLGIRVIKTAFTKFAVKADHLSFIISYLENKIIIHVSMGFDF